MKYGIITHYDVHNHGALLQLNALIRVLDKMGIEAQALRFDKNYDFMGRELKAKYEPSVKSIGIYVRYLLKRGMGCTVFNYKKKKLLDSFRSSQHLIGDYYTECGELDGVVVGSDEVFALHTGPTPAFFGHALPSNKVFSYAGCFGPTTIEDIVNRHCREFVASGLSAMKGLGMRDQNSISIAKTLTGKEPALNCDPVILYGYEDEVKSMARPLEEKYMVVYAYDTRFNDEQEYEQVKSYARASGLTVVSPGFYHRWVDRNVNVDPIGLINWFRHADCVVTDTFHGCVLSIITGREMAVRLRDNANKLQNLMEEYGLTRRTLDDTSGLDAVFREKVDWNFVDDQIKARRKTSMEYLQQMTTF